MAIDLNARKVCVTSSVLGAEELTEVLKKTGREVRLLSSRDA